jgi:predicted RNA-binding protein with PUA-like domain
MRYWLMKTEPGGFSIDDLVRRKLEPWTGVRNYTARNTMRDLMQVGDGVLFYHSSCAEPGVAGLARVASEAFPDPTQFVRKSPYHDPKSTRTQPRWQCVEVAIERKLSKLVSLEQLRASPAWASSLLLARGNRLSVLPATRAQWDALLALEKAT